MIAVVFIVPEILKFVMFVLTMQRYSHFNTSATNGYELFSILHRKKIETQLSKISIAIHDSD